MCRQSASWTQEGGRKANVGGAGRVDLLQAAVGGIGVEDEADFAGDQRLVIAGAVPAEDFVGHGFVLQLRQVIDRGDRFFAMKDDHPVFVLNAAAKAPDHFAVGHFAVDFRADADADGDAGCFIDGAPANEQVFVGCRSIRIAGFRPELDVIVAVVEPIAGDKAVKEVAIGQVGYGCTEMMPFAKLSGRLRVDVAQIVQTGEKRGGRGRQFE